MTSKVKAANLALTPPGKVLLTELQIQRKVKELAQQIGCDYHGTIPIFVGVLKGVMTFMADLIRQVPLPLSVEFMSLDRSGDGGERFHITQDLAVSIAGKHLLVVEDIVDTGITLHHLLRYLQSKGPATLKVCALLDKRARRLVDVPLDYAGFHVPDEFVVGYGLDYREMYRNLPYVTVLKLGPQGHKERYTGLKDTRVLNRTESGTTR